MTITERPKSATKSFSKLKAFEKLNTLAKHPLDLTKEGNLTPERLKKFSADACGYKLLYGTERIDENTLLALKELAEEAHAIDQMEAMQNGEIVNFIEGFASENRPALHTALRDQFEKPNTSKAAKEAADTAKVELDKLKAFMDVLDKRDLTDLIVIGIGGSELGPKAHYEALLPYIKKGRKVYFVGNIDPDALNDVLTKVDLKKSLGLIISKTGTTLETLINEELLTEHFKKIGLKPQEHLITVTAKGSPLDDKKKYLEVFNLWDWVGGRYSTTSMVGGVLLAFAYGFDVFMELLKGANSMDKVALNRDINKNLPLVGALIGIWNRNFLHYPLVAIIPYAHALGRFPSHIQQLDMESNGKHIDKQGHFIDFETGPFIFGEPGTNAQHSFYQLLHQGTNICPLEMISYKLPQRNNDKSIDNTSSQEKLLSNLFAQSIALAMGQKSENPNKDFQGNRPNLILLGKQLTAFSLGALLAYYEHKVAFQGFIWHINSFDQEGVQLGKVLATKIIQRFASKTTGKVGTPYPLGDAYLNILDEL
ncbi:MAG: glucose-6-phosphate isomerase [Parachlamydiaceae bacterium]|nr:glucose-6-phosphate isomerase [Parachlamydiaceae bacterium]